MSAWMSSGEDSLNWTQTAPVAPPPQPSFATRAKAFTSSLLSSSAAFDEAQARKRLTELFPGAVITSGRRSAEHNRAIGGAANSMHVSGEALDFQLSDPSLNETAVKKRLADAGLPVSEFMFESAHDPHSTGPHFHWGWRKALRQQSPGYGAFKPRFTAAGIPPEIRAASDEISSPGFLDHLAENFGAGREEGLNAGNTTADLHARGSAYQEITDAVNRLSPPDQQVTNPVLTQLPATRPFGGAPANTGMDRFWQRVAQLKAERPGDAANLPDNDAAMTQQIREHQQRAIAEAQETGARTGPVASGLGRFGGMAAAGFEDPVNLLAMGMGAPASSSLLRTFVLEGALNAGADAVTLPDRLSRYERLGAEAPSGEDIAAELAADFVLGGALPTSIKAAGRGLHGVVSDFDTRFPQAAEDARAARNAVADQARRESDNPHTDDEQGRDRYRKDLAATEHAIDNGTPLPGSSPLLQGSRALDPAHRREGTLLQPFRTDELTTDAATMQYKRGGDESGITDRLHGVDAWDPVSAGVMTVWEREDGTHIVANGHQRLGLAKRLEANGHPAIDLHGFVFREADGWGARDMRVMGALTNLREGSGEAIDAAQILREAPGKDFGLPPRSPLVKRARDLSNLQGTAWDMAWNGAVTERDAAIVGRFVKDEPTQTALLAYVAKAAPATAEEAEIIVRQALAAGAHTEVQTDLFGDMLRSNLVLPERIAILKASLTQLRRDRALFNTLVSKENAIADAGNVLNPEENAKRQLQANTVFATLKALAERKGPVSDALQSAAEESLRSGKRSAATKQFLADVRSRMGEGLDRLGGDGEPLRDGDVAAEAAAAAEREVDAGEPRFQTERRDQLDAFKDPQQRDAFDAQTKALARELAPEEVQKRTETGEQTKPEFGDAQPEIDALRAMPDGMIAPDQAQYGLFSPDSEGVTLKEVRTEIEREARAVERLRGCIEGGGDAV